MSPLYSYIVVTTPEAIPSTMGWIPQHLHFYYPPPQVRIALWSLVSTMALVFMITITLRTTPTATVPLAILAPDARTLITTTVSHTLYTLQSVQLYHTCAVMFHGVCTRSLWRRSCL